MTPLISREIVLGFIHIYTHLYIPKLMQNCCFWFIYPSIVYSRIIHAGSQGGRVAFDNVKCVHCSPPLLTASFMDHLSEMQMGTSYNGSDAMLLQCDRNGVEHPVSLFSRKSGA
ncbi:hypothetical protein ATANTOWER_009834 [Ataeniobius toweri]|uniref:Uncharacterized protein n=1 Tax=Ataeniobius toweri TaxID=208326 RepID=A0ABU7BXN4_9TELE|nr:hypothetical protein [Ataeniobius toweri]